MTDHARSPSNLEHLEDLDLSQLPVDGGDTYNRLVFEQSPYLLQHATNPIDWHPWGLDAFEKARQLDIPVLLSIGYSTCHWCHVMAHESFESSEVAQLVNTGFVAIKVDREERPDVDNTYMAACQLMTGSGGWPLTLLLTADKKPFFAATYLPRRSTGGHLGLTELLNKVSNLWTEDRQKLLESSEQLATTLQQLENSRMEEAPLDKRILDEAVKQYRQDFDPHFHGFGPAPKFPAPHNLEFLLRPGIAKTDADTAMALDTLKTIRKCGVYDQIGFGLHRYAVDTRWLVPHFEKMLYDQALFTSAAVAAWDRTGETGFRQMALDTTDYVLRTLQHSEGGFYCGEDADSEGEEGTFYLWDLAELGQILTREEYTWAHNFFGVTTEGNFEGRNILQSMPAQESGESDQRARDRQETVRHKLFEHRETRPHPHLDNKILCSWNGLMIGALAKSGSRFDRADHLQAANRAADLILDKMYSEQNRLLRRYRRGQAAIPGFLEDYAFLAWGLLELYSAEFTPLRLEQATTLARQMLQLFAADGGGLHDSGSDAEVVLVRGRNLQDGAIPSAISVASELLVRLGRLTGDTHLKQVGESLIRLHLGQVKRYPRAFSWFLSGLDLLLSEPQELLIVVGENRQEAEKMLRVARSGYQPNRLICVLDENNQRLKQLIPWADQRLPLKGMTTAWFCQARSCREPVTSATKLGDLLQDIN